MLTKQALYTIESCEEFGGTTYTLKVVDGLVSLEAEEAELYLGDLDESIATVGEILKALKEVKNGDYLDESIATVGKILKALKEVKNGD
jgi:DNA-binding transcriptional ArsR family regulator